MEEVQGKMLPLYHSCHPLAEWSCYSQECSLHGQFPQKNKSPKSGRDQDAMKFLPVRSR